MEYFLSKPTRKAEDEPERSWASCQSQVSPSTLGLGPPSILGLPLPLRVLGVPLPLRAFLCFEKVIKASTYPPWQVVLGSVIRRLNHLMIVHLHFAQIPQDCDLLPWWSSRRVTATTCLHSNWLLTTTLEQSKHTHRNARTPSGQEVVKIGHSD